LALDAEIIRIDVAGAPIKKDVAKMLKIISLKEEHLEDAALLVSNRYRRLCEQEPHLPHPYAEVDTL
jgi:hypothetical protein